MPASYSSIQEIIASETRGESFDILTLPRTSSYLILALHGGNMEPPTSELASFIAGNEHSFYSFVSYKPEGDKTFHVTSAQFQEPSLEELLKVSDTVISLHCVAAPSEEFLFLGGRDTSLGAEIQKNLESAYFSFRETPARYAGKLRRNPCNRGRAGAGVQLEISYPLAVSLKKNLERREEFVRGVRSALRMRG